MLHVKSDFWDECGGAERLTSMCNVDVLGFSAECAPSAHCISATN